MKVAVIGSRSLLIDPSIFIPENISCIISGGANGIDSLVENYADKHNILKCIYRPEYHKYGRNAPLMRNKTIVDEADLIIALWDGKSSGTKYTIAYAKKLKKPIKIYVFLSPDSSDEKNKK